MAQCVEGTRDHARRSLHVTAEAQRRIGPGVHRAVQQPDLIGGGTLLRAKNAGLWRSHVRLGEFIKKNQNIGSITDPYGEMEVRLNAPSGGYVVGLNNMPVVNQGDALLHISF